MDKLVELLNEYWNDYCWHNYKRYFEPNRIVWEWCDNSECSDLLIISEKFWFIQWLVEQDKIDLLRLDNRIDLSEFNKDERVLMALSIQDNPIEFLCEILNYSENANSWSS